MLIDTLNFGLLEPALLPEASPGAEETSIDECECECECEC